MRVLSRRSWDEQIAGGDNSTTLSIVTTEHEFNNRELVALLIMDGYQST